MKICILTQPLGTNYGCILQAYALQKVLTDMGHDVTTLRFRADITWVPSGYKKYLLTIRRFISKYIKGNKSIICCNPHNQTQFAYQDLDRFVSERMHCLAVKPPLNKKNLPSFDAYIVGSDQVWRPEYSPFLPNFYLDFLGDTPAKRIAYAASFGVDTWEADDSMTERIRPLAKKFDAVTVRETSGVTLCEKYLGVKAEVMPDPTFLLTAKDYLALFRPSNKKKAPYIAAYILDRGEVIQSMIDRVSADLGLPVKYIGLLDWAKKTDALESWLEDIYQASFVITNSFHGTVFSIIFEKDFLSISNNRRGASRFMSLLESVGLQDQLIREEMLDHCPLSYHRPDYTKARVVLRGLREQGLSFLSLI